MRKKLKQLMGILLSLVLVLGLMPGMSLTAYAADDYSSLKNTKTPVKFDGKEWYLIECDSSTVTLLSKECVGASAFGSNSTYSGSTVETYVNNWYKDNIKEDAKTAVADSKMFLLTKNEADAMTANTRKCSKASGAQADYWWLCSSGRSDRFAACVFGAFGDVSADGLDVERARCSPRFKAQSVICHLLI